MRGEEYLFTTPCSPRCVCASSRGMFRSLRRSLHLLDFLAMPTIQIKKTGEEPGAASLAVTVPVEQVQEAEARATSVYQRRARLPGFRKGKAPAALVKRQFAEDIRQQTLEELIRESWKAALAQEALKPIADPHIHNLKWDAGTPVTFEFHVEVKPELTLERIGKFHLKRTAPKVTEDRVLAQLNELREQKAPWTPVAADKPKPKDLVQVTIATREGDAVKDPQPYQLVLGEGRAIPEVEERIMGMLPGETVDATVRFPSDFPEEAKRGQPRDIRLTLHEVKRQQLPELDDAFAREVGDFESLEALRKVVREDLEKEAQREADAQVRDAREGQATARSGARPYRRESVYVSFVANHRGASVTRNQIYPPYIIERSSRGERTYDIFSRLLMDRIVFLGTQINDEVSNIIIAQLLFLDADNPERDIYLYVNSPGGLVSSGMAIYDTMQFLRAPVNTICMGMAASMGSFLLAAGRKGKRSALPHARIMMHQPSGGTQGTAADIEIQAREILYLRGKLNELYAKHTGKPVEHIEKDMDRDRFMSAEEAKEYGLIDHVIANFQEIDDGKKK